MSEKKIGIKENWYVLNHIFKIVHQLDASYIVTMLGFSLLKAIVPFVNIIMPKFIIDELMGDRHIQSLVILVLVTILLNAVLQLVIKWLDTWITIKNRKLLQGFEYRMAHQIATMDFEKTEDPSYLDLHKRAMFPLRNRNALRQSIQLTTQVVENGLILIGLAGLILTFNPIVLVLIALVVAINVWLYKKSQEAMFALYDFLLPHDKAYFYYCGLVSNFSYGKDIRLNNASSLIMDKIQQSSADVMQPYLKVFRKQCLLEGARSVNTSIQVIVVYGYLIYSVLKRTIGLGDFSMYLGSANKFSTALADMINHYVELRQMCKYLEAYVEFSKIEPKIAVAGKPLPLMNHFTLTLDHVSFKYPGSEVFIIQDVSTTIEQGEKLCLVGRNGAGKTTLIKLICRLYEPTEGRILLNGVDIREYDYESYMGILSVVFQDYKLFSVPIEDNITLSGSNQTKETVESALAKTGVLEKVRTLPKGVKTALYREFDEDGVELSGGQMQKLAIARAIYKDGPIVILDEPTSALDPIAEAEIYETLFQMIEHKTALFISHRLSSCTFCKRILVLDQGRIVEEGDHMTLLAGEGLYAKMFNKQAEKYKIAT